MELEKDNFWHNTKHSLRVEWKQNFDLVEFFPQNSQKNMLVSPLLGVLTKDVRTNCR